MLSTGSILVASLAFAKIWITIEGHAPASTSEREAQIMATVARRERGEHTPWDMVCEMESPISAITDYASMLSLISADEDLGEDVQAPISRVARDIKARAKEVEEWRGKLFHALHPNRDEPDFQDDGNGEVEEAEGDAS